MDFLSSSVGSGIRPATYSHVQFRMLAFSRTLLTFSQLLCVQHYFKLDLRRMEICKGLIMKDRGWTSIHRLLRKNIANEVQWKGYPCCVYRMYEDESLVRSDVQLIHLLICFKVSGLIFKRVVFFLIILCNPISKPLPWTSAPHHFDSINWLHDGWSQLPVHCRDLSLRA